MKIRACRPAPHTPNTSNVAKGLGWEGRTPKTDKRTLLVAIRQAFIINSVHYIAPLGGLVGDVIDFGCSRGRGGCGSRERQTDIDLAHMHLLPSDGKPASDCCNHWAVVNAFCLVASVVLLSLIVFCADDRPGKMLAKQSYLFYNLLTTVVWCWEVSLNLQRIHRQQQRQQSTALLRWTTYLELLFAVYFCGDSIKVLVDWKYKKQSMTLIVIDLVVNMIGYSYFVLVGQSRQKGGYDEILQLEPFERLEI